MLFLGGFFQSALFFMGSSRMEFNKVRSNLEQKFLDLTLKILDETGYNLYDLEYVSGSATLRVFIIDPKTNSALIDDCIKVDRAFNPYCETENWIPDDFVLEVSSPGVYRSLKTLSHFEMAKGEFIECSISGDIQADQWSSEVSKKLAAAKKLRGKLINVEEKEFTLDFDGLVLKLKYEQVKKACLDPEIGQ